MRTAYKIKIMLVQKLGNNFCAESEGYTAIIFTPTHSVFIGIRPQ